MSRIFTLSIICFSLLLLVASCASAPPPKKEIVSPEAQMKEIESSTQVKAMNEKILTSVLSAKRDLYRDYKIGPEDLIEISVFEEEKLNKTVRVSSQGNINLPLLGILRVKGLTANELEKEIRDLLAEKYLQDPNVNVFIKEYRSQQISVFGAVQKPGVFDFSGQKTILDVLAVAGGLREDAGPLLFLIRRSEFKEETSKAEDRPDEQKPETLVISLDELLIEANLGLNLPLANGDIINVPVGGKVFVGGEVKSPGGFTKGKKLTLGQVIILAGGLNWKANGSEAKIIRFLEKGGEKEVLTYDAYAIKEGKAEDPYLKDNDVIIIPTSGVKAFLTGVRDTLRGSIGLGVTSVGF